MVKFLTWYKLRIKKDINEYECYLRFKFDPQMQTIRIKAFLNLINLTDKSQSETKLNKKFLQEKLSRDSNDPEQKQTFKYQGNFNICNLQLFDDYFQNGKAMIYQYNDLIYCMDNKKYKIQMTDKLFKIIFYVTNNNNKSVSLSLYNNLGEVYKQETCFLTKNDNVLCHRYFANKNNIYPLEEDEEDEENNTNNSINDSLNNDNDENYNNNNKRKLIKSSLNSAEKENKEKNKLNFYQKAVSLIDKCTLPKKDSKHLSICCSVNTISYENNDNNSFNYLCNKIISLKNKEHLLSKTSDKNFLLNCAGFNENTHFLELIYNSSLCRENEITEKIKSINPIFIVILTQDNLKFGFFSKIGFIFNTGIIYDTSSFIFKFQNEKIKIYNIKKKEIAFYENNNYLFYLGGEQLKIPRNFLSANSSCGLKSDIYGTKIDYEINSGKQFFKITELECYKVCVNKRK